MTALFRLLARLPLTWLQTLGQGLGWLAWWASPTYRRRFVDNTQAAGLSWAQVRPAIGAAGVMLAELPWLWMRKARGQPIPLQWDGSEHVEQGLEEGRGVIVLSPHLGCWELGAQILAERWGSQHGPLWVMYRPARKAWLEALVAHSRQRPNLQAAPANQSGVRQLLRALRQGGLVALLPDQVPPLGQGVWAPFWGRDAYTITLAARLARQTQARVVMAWCERLPIGQGFIAHVEPWEFSGLYDPQTPVEEAVLAMNAHIESMVRRAPAQYLWGYARYKQPRAQG
ncbi:MAG: lysophospholipid acyltransferase family protein [Betaproteobacteria bacterium]|nr:lysophospholipid acyltransferase family protein [Betaproteobacteria bacterium]NBY04185.1 lysophospholipid acyltransferase family protein [Betaproteobacteria bacterium]